MKKSIISLAQQNRHVPKSQPSRLWFLGHGYDPIDPTLVCGRIFYIRVKDQEVSILDAQGRKAGIYLFPNKKGAEIHRNLNQYYYLKFKTNGRTRKVPISLLVMATLNHQVPDRSKGEVIDHIDGNTLNNSPRNLRIISRPINDRDAGFMRKMRNNGYPVDKHPTLVILKGYENMAKWKAEHKYWQYQRLRGNDLLRVFFGPMFTIVDPDIIMDLDFKFHREY